MNIKSNNIDRFAILSPPLSGLFTAISLNIFTDISIDNISFLPSGNYSDMISYIYATELSYGVGINIIQNLSQGDIYKLKIAMRWKNIIGMLGLFCILLLHRQHILNGLLALFFIFNNEFIISTSQVLCSLFIISTFKLVISILKLRSKVKFGIIGFFLGLTVGVAGIDGLKLNLMTIIAALIYDDFKNKSLNKGFKKDWVIGVLICFFITIITTWITYGLYLEKLEEVLIIFNIENKFLFSIRELKVIPFYDIFKQTIFEIIFKDSTDITSFKVHLMLAVRYCWLSILLIIFQIKQMKLNQYLIASVLILFIGIISNGQNAAKVLIMMQTISIIMPVLIFLSLYNGRDIKKF